MGWSSIGFANSIINFLWDSNGNATELSLIIFNEQGIDTAECLLQFDNNPNFLRHYPILKVEEYVLSLFSNNLTKMVLKNNESFAPAGTVMVDNTYQYFPNGEVMYIFYNPSPLNDEGRRVYIELDCTLSSAWGHLSDINMIYPNPAHDWVMIDMNYHPLSIFSITGREYNIELDGQKLDIRNLPAGVYLIKLIDNNRNVLTRRLVKQ